MREAHDLFQILKRINSNDYVVDLTLNFGINCTFNIKNLVPYGGTFDTPSDSFMDEPTLDFLSESPHYLHFPPKLFHATENINSILDDQIISTRDRGTRRYHVKWKGGPVSENS